MHSSLTFIKNTVITALIIYVIFAGLLAILATLSWIGWAFVGEWSGRVGLVTLLVVALTIIVSLLVGFVRK